MSVRLALICALLSQVCCLKVQTGQGVFRGLDVATPYGPVASFLGVPYAQPPVGALRFEKPRPPTFSAGVYNATEKKFSCPNIESSMDEAFQLDFGPQDEDCLYLNIWKPANASHRLPVVVYIHGGSFVSGSGNYFAFDGTRLAARAKVVYITVNMRLGPLGFMQLPALQQTNVGLWDIVEAVQWIRKNIADFGGDPEQLTLWGQSAGAIAIDFLLKSSAVLKGGVRRAILQGGTSGTGSSLLGTDGLYSSQQLAHSVGCHTTESDAASNEELLRCLRDVPWRNIIAAMSAGNTLDKTSIQPYVDHKLLLSDVVSSSRIEPSVEELLVFNDEEEGVMFMKVLFKKLYRTSEISTTDWLTSLLIMFKYVFRVPYRATSDLIRQYVPAELLDDVDGADGSDKKEIQLQRHLARMFTDPIFFCPAEHRAATAGEKGVRVYRGEFHFRAGFSFLPSWASMSHAEEIPYLHGNLDLYKPGIKGLAGPMLDAFENTTDTDWTFSDTMIKLLEDFFHGR